MLAVIAVSFALRTFLLGSQSLWLDEGYTAYVASLHIPAIFPELAENDIHPPFHYLVLHGWTLLAGASEFSERFLSAAAGLLAIPLTFKLGCLIRNRATGMIAAAILAISPLHVWYSQEARMYALVTLLSLLSICLLLKAMKASNPGITPGPDAGTAPGPSRNTQAILWTAHAVFTGLSLLTHYYAFLLPPVGLVGVLLFGRNLRTCGKWAASQAGALAIFSIWAPGAINQWGHDPHVYRVPFGIEQVIRNLGVTLTIGDQALPAAAITLAVIIAFGALLLIGLFPLVNRVQRNRAGLAFAIVYLAVPVLLAYLLASGLGVNIKPAGGKYFIILLPPFTLMLASGILALRAAGLPVLLLGAALVAVPSSYFLYDQYFDAPKEDFRSATQYVEEHEWPGDAIILNAEHIFQPFLYYYQGNDEWFRASVSDAEGTGKWLEQTTRGRDRVWLVLSHEGVSDPHGYVEAWLNGHGLLVDEKSFSGVRLSAFAMSYRGVSADRIQYPVRSDFGDRLRLLGYSLRPGVRDGSTLHLEVFWQGLIPIDQDLRVSLGLYDDNRRLWSQTDRAPLAETFKTSNWAPGEILRDHYELPVPPGTPPGEYHLAMRVYSPKSGNGLVASASQGTLQRDRLWLRPVVLDGRQIAGAEEAMRSVETPVMRDLGGFTLVGGTLGGRPASPGASLDLTLLWKVKGIFGSGGRLFLELAGDDASTWARKPLELNLRPDSRQAGVLVRGRTDLAVPASIPGGNYSVRLGMEGETETITLGAIAVQAIERSYDAPQVRNPQAATLGQRSRLLGFDIPEAAPEPGQTIDIALYWQAEAPMDRDYSVFVHILDSNGRILRQKDNMPADGTRPTTTWLPGEVIEDRYRIQLPEDAAPGQYEIAVGMYLPSTGERLPVSDNGDSGQADRVVLNRGLAIHAR